MNRFFLYFSAFMLGLALTFWLAYPSILDWKRGEEETIYRNFNTMSDCIIKERLNQAEGELKFFIKSCEEKVKNDLDYYMHDRIYHDKNQLKEIMPCLDILRIQKRSSDWYFCIENKRMVAIY